MNYFICWLAFFSRKHTIQPLCITTTTGRLLICSSPILHCMSIYLNCIPTRIVIKRIQWTFLCSIAINSAERGRESNWSGSLGRRMAKLGKTQTHCMADGLFKSRIQRLWVTDNNRQPRPPANSSMKSFYNHRQPTQHSRWCCGCQRLKVGEVEMLYNHYGYSFWANEPKKVLQTTDKLYNTNNFAIHLVAGPNHVHWEL